MNSCGEQFAIWGMAVVGVLIVLLMTFVLGMAAASPDQTPKPPQVPNP